MCRSEPQIPLASTLTIASPEAPSWGSGTSSTLTSSGPWKVTARMAARYRVLRESSRVRRIGDRCLSPPIGASMHRASSAGPASDIDPGHLEPARLAVRAGRLGDPRFQRQLLLEVGRLGVLEGDVFALEQFDEDLDEAGVEL